MVQEEMNIVKFQALDERQHADPSMEAHRPQPPGRVVADAPDAVLQQRLVIGGVLNQTPYADAKPASPTAGQADADVLETEGERQGQEALMWDPLADEVGSQDRDMLIGILFS